MTVLWVTFGLPYPPDSGVRLRDFHLIREISKTARILLFCLIPHGGESDAGELRNYCDRIETWEMPSGFPPLQLFLSLPLGAWRNFYPEACSQIRAMALAERPDVVQIEHSLLAAYIQAVPAGAGCSTLLSLHNVAFEQYRQMASLDCGLLKRIGYRIKSWIMQRTETHYIPSFDCCVTVSCAERDLLRNLLPMTVPVVVENGVDCAAPRYFNAPGAVLLFAGVMDYPPNGDAAVFFCRSILPLIRSRVPDVKVLIVGHAPPVEVRALMNEPGVIVTGRVNDIRPYYAQASIAIAPLRAGGGTRLKILEAMAQGRPVVSTSMGCEGLEVEDQVHLLIADDAHCFADSVTRLLLDWILYEKIAAAARSLVEQRYDWPVIGKQLLAAYSLS